MRHPEVGAGQRFRSLVPVTQQDRAGVNVLIVADPGLPSRRMNAIGDRVERTLQDVLQPPIRLDMRTEQIPIRPDNTLDHRTAQRISQEYDKVDVVILLTEMPRHARGKPLVAEAIPGEKVAVISCPTIGITLTKRRILKVIVAACARVVRADDDERVRGFAHRWTRWVSEDDGARHCLYAHTVTGAPRTVLGMVMANDPWRTAPSLSSAMAAASAVGAFGIFYSSIWQMSDAQSTLRLIAIGALAIGLMVAWLILSNRLWDAPVRERLSTVVGLYNTSTVVTLLLCMTALYLALFLAILVGGLIVISPEFMATILDGEVTFRNYLDIAWLSAAMGVIAGGLGSSFDSRTDLRRLTHGQRERQRVITEDDGADTDVIEDRTTR